LEQALEEMEKELELGQELDLEELDQESAKFSN
jgi:hypothetical protein